MLNSKYDNTIFGHTHTKEDNLQGTVCNKTINRFTIGRKKNKESERGLVPNQRTSQWC